MAGRKPRDDANPGPARAVWLHLLAAGEPQTSRQIAAALSAHGIDQTTTYNTLRQMLHRGRVVRRGNYRRALYVVTPACLVPTCITLAQITDAARAAMLPETDPAQEST